MRRHPGTPTLAAYADGLLRHGRAGRITAHLAGCASCAAALSGLRAVSATLGATPAPPLPSEVTARIQAALTAEATARAATSRSPAEPTRPAREPTAPRPARQRWLTPRVAGLAAAGAAVIVAGSLGLASLGSGGGGTSASSASTSRGALSQTVPANAPLGASRQATAKAPVPGATRLPAAPGLMSGYRVVATGTSYRARELAAQARALLALFGLGAKPARFPTLDPLVSTDRPLVTCLARAAVTPGAGLADVAHYQGHPAVIIVTAGAGGRALVRVASPGCATERTLTIAAPPR